MARITGSTKGAQERGSLNAKEAVEDEPTKAPRLIVMASRRAPTPTTSGWSLLIWNFVTSVRSTGDRGSPDRRVVHTALTFTAVPRSRTTVTWRMCATPFSTTRH